MNHLDSGDAYFEELLALAKQMRQSGWMNQLPPPSPSAPREMPAPRGPRPGGLTAGAAVDLPIEPVRVRAVAAMADQDR